MFTTFKRWTETKENSVSNHTKINVMEYTQCIGCNALATAVILNMTFVG